MRCDRASVRSQVTMAGRRIRDVDDAREIIDAAAASGVPETEWARAHGIDGRSLRAWRLNLGRGTQRRIGMVELVPSARRQYPRSRRRCMRSGVVCLLWKWGLDSTSGCWGGCCPWWLNVDFSGDGSDFRHR